MPFDQDHGFQFGVFLPFPMAYILFRCPYTGLNVQYPLSDSASQRDDKSAYEAITCPACSRLHFVNRLTGKLLGDHKKT